ncbi:MAG: hypothetical protein A2Y10_16325 [Planctomycetes bacterium GWF2_41_51]|nr:MAG: hypothetical protein A2Y10_16325 [Planctomycetes bacterium GWF2_41_51]HBG26121.1 hypothetical protein [Phycisphaerales bacterium]
MQNQQEITKINYFLSRTGSVIIYSLKTFLQAADMAVKEKGHGLDTVFHIKAREKELELYLGNLLLEIATIDRDAAPLRFDEGLLDFDYFLNKLSKVIDSKLQILFKLLEHEDVDKAMESITELAANYERICILKLDSPQY